MPAAAAIGIGAIGSAVIGSRATSKASSQAAAGTAASIASQERMFDISRADLAPYRDIGEDALQKIKSVFIEGNLNEFQQSADYQFNLEQGEQALDRRLSASGSRYGGRAVKEALRYSQGLASGEYSNFFNRLFQTANLGEAAAAQSAANATSTGTNIGNTALQGAQTQANLTMAGGQAMNQALQGGLSNYVTLTQYNDLINRLPAPTPTSTLV